MGELSVVAWVIVGASVFALAAAALGLAKSLILPGPRRLLQSGLEHLSAGDFASAARDFSKAQRKAHTRGDLGAMAAAWRGLAEVRSQRGDLDGAAAATQAASDAERQTHR